MSRMSSLLSIPIVVRIKILSHLTLNEQLLLRQVCKLMREWIDSSSLPYHAPVTVINDHGAKTFLKFLERRPPHILRSLYIKNNNDDFLNDPALPYFMDIYASSITSLRMQRFFPCKSAKEVAFFEGFTNLEALQLDRISIPSESDLVCVFPNVFKNLKTLKIGNVNAYPEPPDDQFGSTLIPLNRQRPMGRYVWDLIRFCENIEFLGYPRTSKYFFQAFVDGRGRGQFGVFCDYVRERRLRNANGPQLKFCDFQNDNWNPDSKNALPLLKMGTELGIKFLNLNSNLFQYIRIDPLIKMYDLPGNAGDCILSFKHFNCLITKCLPSVEIISMSASEVNTMLDYSCVFNGPKTFPNLREIEIIIDVGFPVPETDIYYKARALQQQQTLFTHFFYDTDMILLDDQEETVSNHVRIYENVSSLVIKFPDLPSTTCRKANPEDLPLEWIIKSLPNLSKLVLHGWSSQNTDIYNTMIRGFPKLEELILDNCEFQEGSCYNFNAALRRITLKTKPGQVESTFNTLCDIIEGNDFHPSIFLNKCNHHQQITWCRSTGES